MLKCVVSAFERKGLGVVALIPFENKLQRLLQDAEPAGRPRARWLGS